MSYVTFFDQVLQDPRESSNVIRCFEAQRKLCQKKIIMVFRVLCGVGWIDRLRDVIYPESFFYDQAHSDFALCCQ